MAIHSTLDIYKVTYQLSLLVAEATRNFPRDQRDMGKKIREECLELVVLIYRANSATNKVPHLNQLLERLQVMELMFRLSKDLRLLSLSKYARAIELTASIGKQGTGWRNYYAKSPAA